MDCNSCKEQYYVDIVGGMAERANKRLVRIIVLLIVLLLLTNGLWIYRETQFATEEVKVVQENDDGYNNYIGNDGDIVYGNTDDYN